MGSPFFPAKPAKGKTTENQPKKGEITEKQWKKKKRVKKNFAIRRMVHPRTNNTGKGSWKRRWGKMESAKRGKKKKSKTRRS